MSKQANRKLYRGLQGVLSAVKESASTRGQAVAAIAEDKADRRAGRWELLSQYDKRQLGRYATRADAEQAAQSHGGATGVCTVFRTVYVRDRAGEVASYDYCGHCGARGDGIVCQCGGAEKFGLLVKTRNITL